MRKEEEFTFKILIKREADAWVAHCLELGLVAVAPTVKQTEADMFDIIAAHVRYAIENNNLEHMYHPAPPEVWREFFDCDDRERSSHRPLQDLPDDYPGIVPVIQAGKCYYGRARHA